MCSNPDHQLVFLVPAPTPFPFNQLPPPFISTFSQGLLNLFPLPNTGTNIFTSTVTKREDYDQGGVRIDHYLTSNDSLNFRYMINDGSRFDPLSPAGASVPGFPVTENQRSQNFVAQETHTFSPTMIGTFRFSFLRNKFLFGERSGPDTPGSLGFNYDSSLNIAAGAPHLIVSSYTTVGEPITGPRRSYENAYDYSGSLSWVRGRHELRFGGGFQHQHINMLQGIATNGFFVFAPFPFTDPFANFMIGQPVFFLQGRGDFGRGINGNSFNGYVQDSFKATSRLTLNLGLRYDFVSPYTEERDRMTQWIPGRQSTVVPDAPEGLLYPGDKDVPRGLIPTFKKAFAPRVGLAWDPTGSSKWLVTSAYGIFYEPYYTGQGGPLQSPISAPPFLQTEQINLTPSSPLSFQDPYGGPPPPQNTFATPLTNLTLAPNLPLPYAQDWDLNVQRSLGKDMLLEVGYVGTKGTKLPRFIEANPTVYIPGQTTADNVDQRRIHSGCGLTDPESACEFASTGLITGIANSSYNAMEASLRKRFSHGVSFLASYTWSHAIDDVSSFNIAGSSSIQVAGENDLAQDPRNLAAERGPSLFDARHRLVEQEKRLEAYRLLHGPELPTQLQSNMQAIQNLQLQIQSLNDSLNRDRDRRLLVARQVADLQSEQFIGEPAPGGSGSTASSPAADISIGADLEKAIADLRALEGRLTPQHPDVIRAKRLVDDLESKARSEAESNTNGSARSRPLTATEISKRNRVKELQSEVESLDRQIAKKLSDETELRATLQNYRSHVEAVPTRESELASLTRDYDTLQTQYRTLLAKKEDSKVAEELERRQVGEQFKVVDPPRRPEKPYRPNRPLIDMAGAAGGLALGIALTVLLELTDRSFKTATEVGLVLNMPVIGLIPMVVTYAERRRVRWRRVGFSFGLVVMFAACAAVVWLTFRI